MIYFDISEFDCQETGQNEMDEEYLNQIDWLREDCGFPFIIVSGFRAITHSLEIIKKDGPGFHPKGIAADVGANGALQRGLIVRHAIARGFTGIGIARTFIHVDRRPGELFIWPY